MRLCRLCSERRQDWSGDAPVCSFTSGLFSPEGWNCATANAIREICYEGNSNIPRGVHYQFCEDQKYSTIKISEIEDATGDPFGLTLWVSWYKNRGRTDAMWILNDDSDPRRPIENECLAIIAYYDASTHQRTHGGDQVTEGE